MADHRERTITEAYNAVTGQDGEWSPESIQAALEALYDAAYAEAKADIAYDKWEEDHKYA